MLLVSGFIVMVMVMEMEGRGLTCDGTGISGVCDDGVRGYGHGQHGRKSDER